MAHPYFCFSEPRDPELSVSWRLFIGAAISLRSQMDGIPEGTNKNEAITRLDKAVMVAQGAFHVHPR